MDGRRVYGHAKTVGYLYGPRLHAADALPGCAVDPVRNGIADVAGFGPAVPDIPADVSLSRAHPASLTKR